MRWSLKKKIRTSKNIDNLLRVKHVEIQYFVSVFEEYVSFFGFTHGGTHNICYDTKVEFEEKDGDTEFAIFDRVDTFVDFLWHKTESTEHGGWDFGLFFNHFCLKWIVYFFDHLIYVVGWIDIEQFINTIYFRDIILYNYF